MPFSDTPLPPNAFRYENLRLDDLRGRDLSKDIVIIPVSPCENHGTHLPTGTDIYITEEFARRVAGIYGARHPETRLLLYPHITVGSATIRGMGSVKITSRQLRRGLLFLCRRFMVLGFRHFVFLSAHGGVPHTGALDDVCKMLRARGATALAPGARAAVHAYRGEYVTRLRERGVPLPDGIEHLFQHDLHAGCMETAMMLAIAPDLVSPDYQKVPDLFAKDRWWLRGLSRFILGVARLLPLDQLTKDSLAIGTHVGAVDLSWIIGGRGAGYHGAPARATEALGEGLLGVVSEDLARAIEEVFLEGADPEAYRSAAYLFNWFKNIVFAVVVIVFALVMMSVT